MSPRIELEVIHLGTFPQGSDPDDLEHQYLDDDGETPVNMSAGTWAGEVMIEQLHVAVQPAGLGAGTPIAINTSLATATYPWTAVDMSIVGRFRLMLWAGNSPAGKRHGQEFEYNVDNVAGAVPTV